MRSGSKFYKGFSEGDDEEGEGGFLASYSDLMTDLLAIFVVLFSFAMIQHAISTKAMEAQQTSVISFDGTGESIMPGEDSVLPDQDSLLQAQDSYVASINDYIDETGLSEQLSVTKQGDNTILLRVSASVLFDSGRADIQPDAELLLGRISNVISKFDDYIKMVRIEGHTDNVPVSSLYFDSNWELSSSRAVNVLKRLIEISRISPDKFSAIGYAEFHPIADNDTTENKALNRRVDFIIETLAE